MKPIRIVVFVTITSWLPILSFFYLPNSILGVGIKVLAAIFLLSLCYNFTLGPGVNIFGSAGAGFILNGIWFTIINLHPPRWVGFVLWFLILTAWGTCYKTLKRMAEDPSFDGMRLYDKEEPD